MIRGGQEEEELLAPQTNSAFESDFKIPYKEIDSGD